MIIEPIVMFLSLSFYQLFGEATSIFDSTICRQHLNECLLSCLSSYDELDEKKYHYNKRIIIEGIYVLLNLSQENSLRRALNLKFSFESSFTMQTVLKIALNMHTQNYFKVIHLIPRLPHVLCAIASLKLMEIRKEILKTFTIAYSSNNLRVPADFTLRVLSYDRIEDLQCDLKNLGICYDETENSTSINFNRKKFNIENSCVSC
jgi:SAC3 domain-containing protein 1